MSDIKRLRRDFPILSSQVQGSPLVYLDNAATTHKPRKVIDRLSRFYKTANSNVHRGAHSLSRQATAEFEAVREEVADWIGAADSCEVIWTSGATESANLVAQSFAKSTLKSGDVILVSAMEHHANIVPWQQVAEQAQAQLIPIPLTPEQGIDLDKYRALLDEHQPKLVTFTHVSNALGVINPIHDMTLWAKAVGATVVIDGAQAIAHQPINLMDIGCDFYFFSAHKCYGPTALGVLWGRKALLNAMPPWKTGGEMIKKVSFSGTTFNDLPFKFEAGTPPIAEVIAFGEAVRYLKQLDRSALQLHEQGLRSYCLDLLKNITGLTVFAEQGDNVGIISFIVKGLHHQDLATLLDQEGIAIRSGHHCAMPLMESLNCQGTLRLSFALYNTAAEVDQFYVALKKSIATLHSNQAEAESVKGSPAKISFITVKPYAELRQQLQNQTSWQERLSLLMQWAEYMPDLPKEYKVDKYRINGCESELWLVVDNSQTTEPRYALYSDARVMRGLGFLLVSRIFFQEAEIIDKNLVWNDLLECQLAPIMSESRSSGVRAMIAALVENASAYTLNQDVSLYD